MANSDHLPENQPIAMFQRLRLHQRAEAGFTSGFS